MRTRKTHIDATVLTPNASIATLPSLGHTARQKRLDKQQRNVARIAKSRGISLKEANRLLQEQKSAACKQRRQRIVERKANQSKPSSLIACPLPKCGEKMIKGKLNEHLRSVHGMIPKPRMSDWDRHLWLERGNSRRTLARTRFVPGGLPSLGKRR